MQSIMTVCIVGRPNVGKSTLFNKLTGTRTSLVNNQPGVTRDRIFGRADISGVSAYLIDTGGLEPDSSDLILSQVKEQALLAMEEADVICLVVDGRAGLTKVDEEIAGMLRRSGKRVVIAVNKLDTPSKEAEFAEFFSLGFESVHAISAEHSVGLYELCDSIAEGREKDRVEEDEEVAGKAVTIAIVGRPNVGKSSLINRLLGEDRMLVTDIPGTTRDSVDSVVKWHGREFVFIDTAGLRKKSRISQKIEKYSVVMTLKAVSRCNIAIMVVDAERGVDEQESKIAGVISDEAKGCIIVVNKWDLVEKDSMTLNRFEEEIKEKLKFISYAPVLFVSAMTGQRLNRIYEEIEKVHTEYLKRVDTGPLNRKVSEWMERMPPPIVDGRRGKIYYVSQTKTAPPIFNFSVNSPRRIPDHYKRYLVNRIREEYGFAGAPVVCRFQAKRERQ